MTEFSVKPVLLYGAYTKREKTSWRPWGAIQTEEDAEQEVKRIQGELALMLDKADFQLAIQSVSRVHTDDDIRELAIDADCILIYGAGVQDDNSIEPFKELLRLNRPLLFFLRKDYLWYEILHPRFLRESRSDSIVQPVLVDDIIVEDYDDLLWKLRSLRGLHLTKGARIVSIGNPGGWDYDSKAADIAQRMWDFKYVPISYEELRDRIEHTRNIEGAIDRFKEAAADYISRQGVTLSTEIKFVENAFVLEDVIKGFLEDHDSTIFTVEECMSAIMPIAETTACLSLGLLNDAGYTAFCESDFVVIPAGILISNISQKPVFLVDPTLPYKGEVVVAHCTAPRRMDGTNLEHVEILTHFESDYGAAPQVRMREGQIVTVVDPDFQGKEWIGFRARIRGNTSYQICRTQIEIEIEGDWEKLLSEMKGFHWIVVYDDYLKEIGYALKKLGIEFQNISKEKI